LTSEQHRHEIEHGRYLASGAAEEIWGWGTPAGQLRAKRRAGLIIQGADLAPSSVALEIGCGTGLFTEMFASTTSHIIAVDISPDLLKIARDKGIPGVTFLEKSFEDWDGNEAFDAVIGNSILHHLDLERALPKIFDLLKPGGRLSFAEPNMLNPQIYCERHFRRFFPQVSPDETAFVRTRFHTSLQQIGFTTITIQPFDWLHPATPPFLIPLVSAVGRICESVWPVREFAGSLQIKARRPE
jgi:SAM-dependent methyltransferase